MKFEIFTREIIGLYIIIIFLIIDIMINNNFIYFSKYIQVVKLLP